MNCTNKCENTIKKFYLSKGSSCLVNMSLQLRFPRCVDLINDYRIINRVKFVLVMFPRSPSPLSGRLVCRAWWNATDPSIKVDENICFCNFLVVNSVWSELHDFATSMEKRCTSCEIIPHAIYLIELST